ncbi:hypothetical protein ACFOVU_11685 [Nocardiopsis sediminis]|uniref:Uncharacterized protein n=1 Tax=Nocardiopsis sediminis TaxID=1778267 RepID=A0ABV8FKB1_9ACTN
METASDDYYVFTGATRSALRRYREFLSPPGRRPLYPTPALCSCRGCELDDVRHARDVLEAVAVRLPVRARAELRRVIAPLDRAFARRTLPDPRGPAWQPEFAERWWHHRMSERW